MGSNPATPTEKVQVRATFLRSESGLTCFRLRVYLRDYRFPRVYDRFSCAPKIRSMTTAPVWITGRICFR